MTSGGENWGTPVPWPLLKPGESLFEESLAPLRHDLSAGIQARSNLIVTVPLGGEEDDLGSNHISIRQRITTRLLL
jgi:hypothetical protein